MQVKSSERRADLRVQFGHAVKCMTSEVLFEAEAVNLGMEGLCLLSPLPLDSGTEVALLFSFTPSGDAPFLALAEVIWSEAPPEDQPDHNSLLGLRFHHLGAQKLSQLAYHVRQLALAGGMLPAISPP